MFRADHGYAPDRIQAPRSDRSIPGAMDEQNRVIDFSLAGMAQQLKKAGFENAGAILSQLSEAKLPDPRIEERQRTTSPADILRQAGQAEAADYVDTALKRAQPQPEYMTDPEAEPVVRPLSAADVDAGYDAAFTPTPEGEPGEATRVFDQAVTELAARLHERTTPVTEDEIDAAVEAQAVDDKQPVMIEATFQKGENPFEGTTIDPKSVEARALETAAAMKAEMEKALKETGDALAKGEVDRAAQIVKDLTTRLEKAGIKEMPQDVQDMYENVRSNLDKAIHEKDPEAKSLLYKFACGALDFVPVVGPAKMLIEAAAGQTLGGDKLTGWKRFLHGTEGLVFLAVDLTGFGAVATKLTKAGKSGMLAAKLLTRTAAFMRMMKVPRKIVKPVFTAGRFLVRHPRLAAIATRGLMSIIKGRKLRLAKELPALLKSESKVPDLSPEQVSDATQRDGMELQTPPDYEVNPAAEAAA